MLNPANYSTISFPLLGIEIDPIRYFNIGPLTVHLYGVVIAFGLLLAGVYCSRRSKRAGLTEDDVHLITESESGYVLKFKSIELWESLRARLAPEE